MSDEQGSAAPGLTVVKVGGGLLGAPADLDAVVAALVRRRRAGERLLVVVSAVQGVTDALELAAEQALDPRSGGEIVRDLLAWLRRRHLALLAGRTDQGGVLVGLDRCLDGLARLLTGIRLTGELTDRSHDLLLAHGERLAAPLVAAVLRAAGADARAVTAEEAGLVAVGPHRVGSCDLEASRPGLRRLDHELHDRLLVLTGFYGVNAEGEVVLFGRGGTDYSAGIAAAGLDAARLEYWKDVPGFMTADPRRVAGARLVERLSFDEACELGYYGARILHPRSLDPLRGRPTEIVVRAAAGPAPGTRVLEHPEGARPPVTALAHRDGLAVVRVRSTAMVDRPGAAGSVLEALGRAGVRTGAVASSLTGLAVTVDLRDLPLARRTLRLLASEEGSIVQQVECTEDVALLGVVGDGVVDDPSMMEALLGTLAGLGSRVHLLAHGPGDVSVSCVLPRADLSRALEALHEAFFRQPSGEPTATSATWTNPAEDRE